MNCPKCGRIVAAKRSRCEMCGMDVIVYRKLYMLSNLYYNKGLEKAKVRDLSGSIIMLRKSLEMNKRNTNARNLLGLVLFEIGETVAALGEWVISKHFQIKENEADYYMDLIQANATKLDSMNQAIKKYNIALDAAKQGRDDLAMIHLKKVVNLNPHFLRAIHLLSLMYLKEQEIEKAKRLLSKALKIDIANTSTLKYLAEINKTFDVEGEKSLDEERKDKPFYGGKIEPITKYKEDKPNIMAWINWFLGIAIGIAVTFFLIVPTARSNIRAEYEKESKDYASELNIQAANISSKEAEIASLKNKILDLEDDLSRAQLKQSDSLIYEPLFLSVKQYQEFIEKGDNTTEEEILAMAESLYSVDLDNLVSQNAKTLFQSMADAVFPNAAQIAYEIGVSMYEENDYNEALTMLLASYHYNKENEAVIFYLGQTYQNLDKFEDASMYYNIILDQYENSSYARQATQKLQEMSE